MSGEQPKRQRVALGQRMERPVLGRRDPERPQDARRGAEPQRTKLQAMHRPARVVEQHHLRPTRRDERPRAPGRHLRHPRQDERARGVQEVSIVDSDHQGLAGRAAVQDVDHDRR